MGFREKIDNLLEINGLKLYELEAKSGIGNGTLQKAYNDSREPSRRIVDKILKTFDISDKQWETGFFDEKLTGVNNIEEGIPVYEKQKFLRPDSNKIPFYDAVVQGGLSVMADQAPISEPSEYVDPGTFLRKATGTIRVYGHSMFPKYPAGCIVAFRDADMELIHWGEDYVIELLDRRIIKRLEKHPDKGYVLAVSYNKSEEYSYAPIDLPLGKIKRLFMVLGKVEMEASF